MNAFRLSVRLKYQSVFYFSEVYGIREKSSVKFLSKTFLTWWASGLYFLNRVKTFAKIACRLLISFDCFLLSDAAKKLDAFPQAKFFKQQKKFLKKLLIIAVCRDVSHLNLVNCLARHELLHSSERLTGCELYWERHLVQWTTLTDKCLIADLRENLSSEFNCKGQELARKRWSVIRLRTFTG